MSLRDELRAKIFSSENRKPKSKEFLFFGSMIEMRQPSFSEIVAMSLDEESAEKGQRSSSLIHLLIEHCYVPGTDERVFDAADRDQLQAMPFGADFARATEASKELTNIDIESTAKN